MSQIPREALTGRILEGLAIAGLKPEAVAAAGTVIGNATALSANANFHTISAADTNKGVILPAAFPGALHVLYTEVATSGLKVYPPVNSTLNGGSANSELVMEGKTAAIAIGTSGTNWAFIFTVNS